MKVSEVCGKMEEIAPLHLACEWDHVGLMVGNPQAEVTGILTCLDVTMEVLEEAVSEGRNMIISHHPFIFHPLTEIDYTSPRGRLVAFAVSHNLNIYSAHTNLDYAERGVNWALAARLGLVDVHWDEAHHHLVGKLPRGDFKQIGARLETCLRGVVPANLDLKDEIIVGVSSGAFDGETAWCLEEGVQVLVTGEVKHSDAIDLSTMPFITLSAGHYETERWIAAALTAQLGEMSKASSKERRPLTFDLDI